MVVISFQMVKIRPLNFGISGECPPMLLGTLASLTSSVAFEILILFMKHFYLDHSIWISNFTEEFIGKDACIIQASYYFFGSTMRLGA